MGMLMRRSWRASGRTMAGDVLRRSRRAGSRADSAFTLLEANSAAGRRTVMLNTRRPRRRSPGQWRKDDSPTPLASWRPILERVDGERRYERADRRNASVAACPIAMKYYLISIPFTLFSPDHTLNFYLGPFVNFGPGSGSRSCSSFRFQFDVDAATVPTCTNPEQMLVSRENIDYSTRGQATSKRCTSSVAELESRMGPDSNIVSDWNRMLLGGGCWVALTGTDLNWSLMNNCARLQTFVMISEGFSAERLY
ncbi:hypothetical protein EVAR_55886_1 [Eumeta japonica]|uniref:Uncharacterized protein n=1 Tax=Eumeta variegata TaxID=151549 RepID=A0A4C1YLC9_EUMVA|nr:hypothetical protein EVAR_55886_1 [Eumeta japonica]